jgi:hypothetical protein
MRLSNVVEKFKAKQTAELQALRKRIQTGREEQKKQRQLDLERLLQACSFMFFFFLFLGQGTSNSSASSRQTCSFKFLFFLYLFDFVASRPRASPPGIPLMPATLCSFSLFLFYFFRHAFC